jgi:hypothetical protein
MQQAANEVFCGARRILRRLILEPPFFPGNLWVVRFLSSPLKNPGFPRVFRISGQLLWLSCLSMHVHACRCCVVSCAALDPGESSSESPESFQNPHFSRENLLFCSGGAGFELGEFESYWYSMLEQRCRECSRRPSIQGASAEIAYHSNH